MGIETNIMVIALAALAGWWLALRPNASYRSLQSPMTYMILTAAALLAILALTTPSDSGLAETKQTAALAALSP